MAITFAGPGHRLGHRVVLPRGDLDLRARRVAWCRENLAGGNGPRWVPPFVREIRSGPLVAAWQGPGTEEVWCFALREDAVMFDMVWSG